jgi:hypothetical protein
LQCVQNTALKCIHKLDFKTHTEEVAKIAGVDLIKNRADTLNINFIKNSKKFENLLIIELISEYTAGSKNFKNKTFLCAYKDKIQKL